MVNADELQGRFQKVFGDVKPAFLVRSPGRVNLIGEHVDYNDGFVLPIAMTQALWVLAAPRSDAVITAHSTAFGQSVTFSTVDPGLPGEPFWANYVRGVAAMLNRQGIRLKGANLLIHSDVPVGGGVSSSAALETGVARALLAVAGAGIDPVPLALVCRQAEHEYAHSPCGIMDQFICGLGQADHALLLDCRSQQYEQIPFVLDDAVLVIMNTQVKHEIGSSQYPVRQKQCLEGLAVLQRKHPEVRSLRDAVPMMLKEAQPDMTPLAFDRCWHVVTEIERTVKAAEALRADDLDAFGKLMVGSHQSLSQKYEVSCPELDALVEVARSVDGVYGARMTGGGFGGCAIALAHCSAEAPLKSAIADRYNGRFKRPALVYTTKAEDGARVQTL
jgi:galactokinase